MKLKVLKDGVLISPFFEEEKSASGIIVKLERKEKKADGKVITVGKDVKDVKKGDHVIYAKYAGNEVKQPDGKDFILVRENDIMAIVLE